MLIIWFKQDKKQYDDGHYILSEDTQTSNLILSISLSVYIIGALYSMIFSFRRLNRPGVGKGIRTLFQKKHSYYVFLFIGIWTI